jgi:hypothetical protein
VEVARRQERHTARHRSKDFGGRRTRISQTTISSGRQRRGGVIAPALFAMVAVQDFIPGTRGVVVIWGNNVHGLGLGL